VSARTPRRRASKAAVTAPGRLRSATPECFETWVGGLFKELGYAVLLTPFQGDHGIDLNVECRGERAIVQCKHWPARGVGEPVVRDLSGTLQHVGADAVYLVTTGNATAAAREWAKNKPIHIWNWQYLVEKWPIEIAELAARTSDAVQASSDIRPGWYVYVDDLNTPWAIKLSKAVGEQPLLGFDPLRDPNLEVVPKLIKLRHINICIPSPVYKEWKQRSIPVGTEQHRLALMRLRRTTPDLTIELPVADGSLAAWQLRYFGPESGAYNPRVRKRAATPLARPVTLEEELARANAYLESRRDRTTVEGVTAVAGAESA
jgi:hypothetical protein